MMDVGLNDAKFSRADSAAEADAGTLANGSPVIPVGSVAVAWAYHSVCKEAIVSLAIYDRGEDFDWPQLRSLGVGYWLTSDSLLRQMIDKLTKAQFKKRRNPTDCLLFYIGRCHGSL